MRTRQAKGEGLGIIALVSIFLTEQYLIPATETELLMTVPFDIVFLLEILLYKLELLQQPRG